MKRWNNRKSDYSDEPKVDVFLAEIVAVCQKHRLSLRHEDEHGAFVVAPYTADAAEWIMEAMSNLPPEPARGTGEGEG